MLEMFKKYPRKELNTAPASNISGLVREGNDLFSDKLILLDESLSGNLFCAETIVVEQNGKLSGNITSKSCVVSGTINGNIVSTDQMNIKSTAIIKGNIQSALINIEPGAVINGCVTIMQDTAAIADLSEKIKGYSPDEYLEAKLAGWLIDAQPADNTDGNIVVTEEKLQDKPPIINSAINEDEEKLQDKPVQITHAPIQAAIPPVAPKTIPSPDETNTRWW
jgi:cytoskeletal protein CcmA (bactofilin family)